MAPTDIQATIARMNPEAVPGEVVFCTTSDGKLAMEALPRARALFAEAEGMSLVLPTRIAEDLGLPVDLPMRQITLGVQSALDGVGLTAAVSTALARADIACNVVAAFHHDHVFVPAEQLDAAMETLETLQGAG